MFSSLLIKLRSSWILFQKKTGFISAEFVLSSVSTKLICTYSFQASWFNCHFLSQVEQRERVTGIPHVPCWYTADLSSNLRMHLAKLVYRSL